MSEDQLKILKVRIDKVTMLKTVTQIFIWLKSDKKRHIITPNPEILLKAQYNHKFLKILNKSDLNIPDGMGILWAAYFLNQTRNDSNKFYILLKWLLSFLTLIFKKKKINAIIPERVTGTDLMEIICKNAPKYSTSIFLLGASKGVAEIVKEKLEKKYNNLNIVGTYSGNPEVNSDTEIQNRINNCGAEVLFVAFGAPKQEIWIHRNLSKLKSVKVAIGIGGAFDFISGKRKRAPIWMQKTGLEWLYRLFKEPSRIKRIFNATVRFPVIVLKKRLKR